MSEQDGTHASMLRQPTTNDDKEVWKDYWKQQGQTWRTEPEIDRRRQEELTTYRSIKPDIEQSIYPFKGVKLSRADVEWLLATHEKNRGPVDWRDEKQRRREGMDLRGANLEGQYLGGLPLARLRGGLTWEQWSKATEEQRNMSAIHMDRTTL